MGDQGSGTAVGAVGCDLTYEVAEPARLVVQVCAYRELPDMRFIVTTDDGDLPAEEVSGSWADGGRQHLLLLPPGRARVSYQATVPNGPPATPVPLTALDRIVAVRPSRYCPSDRLGGFAAARIDRSRADADVVRAVCDYVHGHTVYAAGASGPSTDAADTLLAGQGVCRDFAHLTVALCRALDIPARVVAVYAPGLTPMDFHLVAEVAVDGHWYVWDSTRLAPRQSLVRIATGRDAADVAFGTMLDGQVEMSEMIVSAVAPGILPIDDHEGLVALH
ncbi:transglutaminase family protein [Solwaraspora sp. WMMD406]|uniref:transglutaminase-like domain-containing protein n=1 Tax=Solwaraspora sp. WMMD406 TaxID=3016095 RepID=UPI002417BEBF|nr:transglutaminase family protein [Solwaraspora sp. WMMD406]MDG4766622.1 transglutaminase family protein [Solwaraspora sp. WMMD406]